MKKIITLFSIGIFSFAAQAQGIEIYLLGDDAVDVSGTVINIDGPDYDMYQDFDVKNVSGGTLTLRIERVKILELAGTEDYLCWGANPLTGACYSSALVSPANPFISPDPSDMENDSIGWLSGHHSTLGVSGCAQYRYYVIDDTDARLDSVDLMFCSTVGIEEENLSIEVKAFPNPASNVLNVSLANGGQNVKFELVNVLGESVVNLTLSEGQNTLNVDKLPSGIYFYSIIQNGTIVETKKLMVRH